LHRTREQQIAALEKDWAENPRWKGIKRGYTAADVVRLRGSLQVEHTLAKRGAEKLWNLINTEPFVNTLGALTGNQAMQQVKAGLKAIYLSGWQVAGDANSNGEMYPDQSLYSVDSVPKVVKKINATFARADQIQWSEGKNDIDFFAPIVADAEAGFGGVLNAFELMKAMIEAGAAGVHFEDQLASAKKCGHMGGKVLVPTREAVSQAGGRPPGRRRDGRAHHPAGPHRRRSRRPGDQRRRRQRQALPDRRAHRRRLLPHPQRPGAGHQPRPGLRPYADLIWCETGTPDLAFAKKFADAIHAKFPGKLLAYNCSPSSTGRRTWTTPPSPSSSANWAPWATSSSSSRWPASTA
jgi:isocitrate lyase